MSKVKDEIRKEIYDKRRTFFEEKDKAIQEFINNDKEFDAVIRNYRKYLDKNEDMTDAGDNEIIEAEIIAIIARRFQNIIKEQVPYELLFKVEVVLIGEKKDEYKIRIVLDGIFGFISDGTVDAELKNRLIQTNAVAILLPYLRSEVSILTAQPDTESVVLPPLNVNELFKK